MEETMKSRFLFALSCLIIAAANISQATIFLGMNSRNFEPTEYYDDDFFIGGNSVRFQSEITGDLIGGSRELVFTGRCGGNINWGAQWITVAGAVSNSVRAAGYSIDINADIGRNLIAVGQKITIGPNSRIIKDATLIGEEIEIEGFIGRNLFVRGATVSLSGHIVGDVDLRGNIIEVRPNTVIEGNFVYESPEKIKMGESVQVKGETRWVQIEPQQQKSEYRAFRPILYSLGMFILISFAYYVWVFIWLLLFGNASIIIITFLALIIGGAVVISLNKDLATGSVATLRQRLLPSLGLGVLLILVFPLASLIAFISFFGWPLGFLLLFAGGTFCFAGAIYMAQFIGCEIIKLLNISKRPLSFLGLLLGIVLIGLLILIPVVGWIVFLLIQAAGLGALVLSLKIFREKKRSAATAAAEKTPNE
jgi:hypothetical protein